MDMHSGEECYDLNTPGDQVEGVSGEDVDIEEGIEKGKQICRSERVGNLDKFKMDMKKIQCIRVLVGGVQGDRRRACKIQR